MSSNYPEDAEYEARHYQGSSEEVNKEMYEAFLQSRKARMEELGPVTPREKELDK